MPFTQTGNNLSLKTLKKISSSLLVWCIKPNRQSRDLSYSLPVALKSSAQKTIFPALFSFSSYYLLQMVSSFFLSFSYLCGHCWRQDTDLQQSAGFYMMLDAPILVHVFISLYAGPALQFSRVNLQGCNADEEGKEHLDCCCTLCLGGAHVVLRGVSPLPLIFPACSEV